MEYGWGLQCSSSKNIDFCSVDYLWFHYNISNDAYGDYRLQFLESELWISMDWSCSWRTRITSVANNNVLSLVIWVGLLKERDVSDAIITMQMNFQLTYYINFQCYLRVSISTITPIAHKVTERHGKIVDVRNWGGSKNEVLSWH